MAGPIRERAAAQGLSLDQPHEMGPSCEEVEVLRHRAGQDHLGGLAAGQSAFSPTPYRLAYFGERTLEHCLVERVLGPEEVAGSTPRDSGFGPHLVQARGLIPLLGEESFGGVQDRRSASLRVSQTLSRCCQCGLAQEVAACLLHSKLPSATGPRLP